MKKSLVLGLDKDQKRKEKPALVAQLTLLDIVANGTSIRLFRETAVQPYDWCQIAHQRTVPMTR
ncbi:hypothetical protein DZ11F45_43620 [Escherichia coli]|nr:hypothetical protein [Escherichia coli]EHC2748397.1 hypothetical protein [Escherichia coli]EIS5229577.1 hypothetical protein [Escherichia coli]HBE4648385.1 hypothetical protein [Escherichia coli]